MSSDRVARIVAASSLAVALLALGLAGYALTLANDARTELEHVARALAETLDARTELPMQRPPPQLDDDDY